MSPGEPALTRRRLLALLGALPGAALLGGCGGLLGGGGPPPLLFVLTPKSAFASNLPKVDWQLLIETPVAPASINSLRIALQHSPLEIDYYAGARWPDLAPIMIQGLIIQSFENSQGIAAVGPVSADLRADFVLKCDLRKFQVEYFPDGTPRVRVVMLARLVAMPARAIVGFRRFERTHEAAVNRLSDIVNAFDEALGGVLKPLVEWTLRTGASVRRS